MIKRMKTLVKISAVLTAAIMVSACGNHFVSDNSIRSEIEKDFRCRMDGWPLSATFQRQRMPGKKRHSNSFMPTCLWPMLRTTLWISIWPM